MLECLPSIQDAHMLDMVVHTSNPSTREAKAGVSFVQRQPQLLREFKVILAYLRPCLIYKLSPKLIKDWWSVFLEGVDWLVSCQLNKN